MNRDPVDHSGAATAAPGRDGASTTVAVLGLGAMGLPMALRLGGELPVWAFDVSPERRALAVEGGTHAAASPAEACRSADVAVLAVRDEEQLRGALFGADGAVHTLRPGAVVVLTSTVGPEAARAVAASLAEGGVDLVDAPVSGGPVRAGTGDLLIMVGAADRALANARRVLDLLASTVYVVGPNPGDGQTMKTVNQLLCGIHTAAAAEALALARALGLDLDTVVQVLGSGAAASFMLADRGPRMARAYTGDVELRSRLDVINKDMHIVGRVASAAGVPTPVAAAATALYTLAMRQGMAAEDDSRLVTLLAPEDGTAGPGPARARGEGADR
ncbi:NAD(P)-dependent oxidoreductase [Plantactinospora sp. B5E13]|uniref:NAD(P)-dependent oxidoreductase n=1 Tax=Plantactinospora sp. B5E13 TaxID=3153758 RepID=UPI00325CA5DF